MICFDVFNDVIDDVFVVMFVVFDVIFKFIVFNNLVKDELISKYPNVVDVIPFYWWTN